MKTLYHGGQKSGKSLLAEKKALSLAGSTKPYYIATYNNNYGDTEMAMRIERHKLQRKEDFHSIEESFDLAGVMQEGEVYLVDCISMWILNHLDKSEVEVLAMLDDVLKIDAHMVFVLNDVGSGVIPLDKFSRKFVDMSGVVGQYLARHCDEVYEVKLGLEIRLK